MAEDIDDDICAAIGLYKEDVRLLALQIGASMDIVKWLFSDDLKEAHKLHEDVRRALEFRKWMFNFQLGNDSHRCGELIGEYDRLIRACRTFINDIHDDSAKSYIKSSSKTLAEVLDSVSAAKIIVSDNFFHIAGGDELLSNLEAASRSIKDKAAKFGKYDCICLRKRGYCANTDILKQDIATRIGRINADIAHISVECSDNFVVFSLYFDVNDEENQNLIRDVVRMVLNLGFSMTETRKNGEVVASIRPRPFPRLAIDNTHD